MQLRSGLIVETFVPKTNNQTNDKKYIMLWIRSSLGYIRALNGRFDKIFETLKLYEFLNDNLDYITSKEFDIRTNGFTKVLLSKCVEFELQRDIYFSSNPTENVICRRFLKIVKVVKKKILKMQQKPRDVICSPPFLPDILGKNNKHRIV